MPYITWILIVLFLTASFVLRNNPEISFLVTSRVWNLLALGLWLIFVIVKAQEKIGNYRDFLEKNERDEKFKSEEVLNDLERRGMIQSGERIKKEERVKKDFEYERRKVRRALWRDLFETLLLK